MNIKPEILLVSLFIFLLLGVCAGLHVSFPHEDETRKVSKPVFIKNCTENKGIAVLDLENNMRCVPMMGRK